MNINAAKCQLHSLLFRGLAVAALLPAAGLGIFLVKHLIDAYVQQAGALGISQQAWDQVIFPSFELLFYWCVPLALSVVAAKFLLRRMSQRATFAAGIIILLACYTILSWRVPGHVTACFAKTHEVTCEWGYFAYSYFTVMFGANAAALLGFLMLMQRADAGRTQNARG